MDKKLTLSLNAAIIENAKAYAKANKTSISRLVAAYLSSLTKEFEQTEKQDESLCGVINLPNDFDYKKNRSEYLSIKHQ